MALSAIFNEAFTKNIDELFSLGSKEASLRAYFGQIYNTVDTTVMTEEFAATEGINLPKPFAEKEDLVFNDLMKGYRVNMSTITYGERICFSYETFLNAGDNKQIMDEIVTDEINSAVNGMFTYAENEAHRAFNQAFTNLPVVGANGFAAAFVSPDGEAMISANHSYLSGGTFDNLLPAAVFSQAAIDEVMCRAGGFTDPKGLAQPLFPTVVVAKMGCDAAQAAKRILGVEVNNTQYAPTDVANNNIYAGRMTLVETPYIQSDTSYFFMSDYSRSALKNPLHWAWRDRPKLQNQPIVEPRNLQTQYAYAAAYHYGLRTLPIGIWGSQGA